MLFYPSVLLFLSVSLWCVLGRRCCCVCCVNRGVSYSPARQTPMNLVVLLLPACITHCCIMGRLTSCSFPNSGSQAVMSLAAVKPGLALCVCFFFPHFIFFLKLCGSHASCCDLLRFSEVWSWLSGAFMHLVFPPFLPSSLLKSKFHCQLWSVLNMFVCVFSFIVRGDICTCCACKTDVSSTAKTLFFPLLDTYIESVATVFVVTSYKCPALLVWYNPTTCCSPASASQPLGWEEDKDR